MSTTDDDIDQELLAEFLEEAIEGIDGASNLFIQLEQNPDDMEIIQAIFRPIHSTKGNSAFFNLIYTKKLTHSLENVLDLLRKEAMGVSQTIINALLEGTDEVKRMLERVKSGDKEVSDESLFNELLARLENLFKTEKENESNLWNYLLDILENSEQSEVSAISKKLAAFSPAGQQALSQRKKDPDVSEQATTISDQDDKGFLNDNWQEIVKVDNPANTKSASKLNADKSSSKFMRVTEESVDKFLYFVGELITVGEMYSNFQNEIPSNSESNVSKIKLRRINEIFHNLSSALQKSLLDIRLLPMNIILQKIPRIVRDIAMAEKKQIDVKISGEDIHVDKSIVETLDAALGHMVRNAVDHGIELPDERVKNNKSPFGLIEVNASIVGEDILLTVKDNGKGLNLEALTKKARSMGLITDDAELSKADIVELIFCSGVSTANEVTDISGRGVGMDVVKTSIEQKKGTISVDSTEGQGSVFAVRLPMSVTTVIIKGLVTTISNLNFIFPLESIVTTFAVGPDDLVSVMGKVTSVKKDGKIYPTVFLSSRLGIENNNNNADSIVILLEKDEKKVAVFVDEILGIKQCVLKAIEGIDVGNEYVKGAAIMGDGSVSLVFDIEKLF